MGPAKRPGGAPILEHLAAANAAVGTAAEPSPAPVGTAPSQPSSRQHSSRARPTRLAKSWLMSTCNHHGHRGAHMHARICASAVQESLTGGVQTLVLLSKLATLRNFTRDSQEPHSDAISSMEMSHNTQRRLAMPRQWLAKRQRLQITKACKSSWRP